MYKISESDSEEHSMNRTIDQVPTLSSMDDTSYNPENIPLRSRQQLEPLLEKTDEDDCFVPTSFRTTLNLPTPTSTVAASDCYSYSAHNNLETDSRKARDLLTSVNHDVRIRGTIIITLVAVVCTTVAGFVQVAVPLLAISSAWCCLDVFVLRSCKKEPRNALNQMKKSLPSFVNAYQLCGYGCMGECVGCCFANMFPDHLRSLIVLLTVGIILRFSPCSHNITRISIFVIFIAICRGAACSIVILPKLFAPFVVYGLGVVVGLVLENFSGVLPLRESREPSPVRKLSAEDTYPSQIRQRRRSIMSTATTSSDKTSPKSSSPSTLQTSARGRRTSLPALSMNRHRVSWLQRTAFMSWNCRFS